MSTITLVSSDGAELTVGKLKLHSTYEDLLIDSIKGVLLLSALS
jgi:hypothetical protein